jgi:hypothetical protein
MKASPLITVTNNGASSLVKQSAIHDRPRLLLEQSSSERQSFSYNLMADPVNRKGSCVSHHSADF